MDANRFDSISKLFASRKTRRSAVAGGLGLAAASVASLGGKVLAQNGTPTPVEDSTHPSADAAGANSEFLFVQPFDAGTWAPKDGEEGAYTLTLTGAAANTVYFSDRPERIVGLSPTQQFLDGLGFSPTNPPNAAIVAQREESDGQEILVIELLNPQYDPDAETLTYDARVLADYGEHGLAHLAQQQQDYELGETFGAGSLFIDDCPTHWWKCVKTVGNALRVYGVIPVKLCFDADAGCFHCRDAGIICEQKYPNENLDGAIGPYVPCDTDPSGWCTPS